MVCLVPLSSKQGRYALATGCIKLVESFCYLDGLSIVALLLLMIPSATCLHIALLATLVSKLMALC